MTSYIGNENPKTPTTLEIQKLVPILPIGITLWHNGSRATIPDGCIALDGTSVLNRADFPELWALRSHDAISDSDWVANPKKRGAFSTGNGTTTFRLPDINGVYSNSIKSPVLRGDGYAEAGTVLPYAIDEKLKGQVTSIAYAMDVRTTGVFKEIAGSQTLPTGDQANRNHGFTFDPSLVTNVADETRGNSAFGVYIVVARMTSSLVSTINEYVTKTGGNVLYGAQVIKGSLTATSLSTNTINAISGQIDNSDIINKDLALGWNQTWQDVKSQRAVNVTYTNDTGKPIMLNILVANTNVTILYMDINGVTMPVTFNYTPAAERTIHLIIPPNSTYKLNAGSINYWWELR